MGSQWSRDPVYRTAMGEGYRSRASYKLIDIQSRFGIIRPTDNIIDLGSAPGSWLQVLCSQTEGSVVGIDLNPVAPLDGAVTLTGDFSEPHILDEVREIMDYASVVHL